VNANSFLECAEAVAANPDCGNDFSMPTRGYGFCECSPIGSECTTVDYEYFNTYRLTVLSPSFYKSYDENDSECTMDTNTPIIAMYNVTNVATSTLAGCADTCAATATCTLFQFGTNSKLNECILRSGSDYCDDSTNWVYYKMDAEDTVSPSASPSTVPTGERTLFLINGPQSCTLGGLDDVNTAAFCQAAAILLGPYPAFYKWNPCCQESGDEPYGCILRVPEQDVIWNGLGEVSIPFDTDRNAICFSEGGNPTAAATLAPTTPMAEPRCTLQVGTSLDVPFGPFDVYTECCMAVTSYVNADVESEEYIASVGYLCGITVAEAFCYQAFDEVAQLAPFLVRESRFGAGGSLQAQCEEAREGVPSAEVCTVGGDLANPLLLLPLCCDLVNAYVSSTNSDPNAVLTASLSKALCDDSACVDMYRQQAATVLPTLPVPTVIECAVNIPQAFAEECAFQTPITNVSRGCCDDGAAFFRGMYGDGDALPVGGGLQPREICDEIGCFEGYSEVLGPDVLDAVCETDGGARRSRKAREAAAGWHHEPAVSDGFKLEAMQRRTAAEETECRFSDRCYGGDYCVEGLAKRNGEACTLPATGMAGRCVSGVCESTPYCAPYSGGICESFGLSKGDYVYVRPSPLSYFTVGEGLGDGGLYGMDTLDSLMSVNVAISRHTFYECQLPHLLFACGVTYPRCTVVDTELGIVVPLDETAHAHLLSPQQASGTNAEDRFVAMPAPTCGETCEYRNAYCAESDAFLSSVMPQPPRPPQCSGRFGDADHPPTAFEYSIEFDGQLVYPKYKVSNIHQLNARCTNKTR
jgi:hypothetical protein